MKREPDWDWSCVKNSSTNTREESGWKVKRARVPVFISLCPFDPCSRKELTNPPGNDRKMSSQF
jgi:hypothetical protein